MLVCRHNYPPLYSHWGTIPRRFYGLPVCAVQLPRPSWPDRRHRLLSSDCGHLFVAVCPPHLQPTGYTPTTCVLVPPNIRLTQTPFPLPCPKRVWVAMLQVCNHHKCHPFCLTGPVMSFLVLALYVFLVWEICLWQWFQIMFPRTVPLLVTAHIKGTFQDEHVHQKGHACAEGHPCESWMSLSGRMVAPVRLEIFVS